MAYFNLRIAQVIIRNMSAEYANKLNKKLDIANLNNILPEIMENLYLPKPDKNGIIPQREGFSGLKEIDYSLYKNMDKVCTIFDDYSIEEINKMRICKQADLVMLFYTLQNQFNEETVKRNFEYYENCTLHDSSLSLFIHSLMASRLGMPNTAAELFQKQSWCIFPAAPAAYLLPHPACLNSR